MIEPAPALAAGLPDAPEVVEVTELASAVRLLDLQGEVRPLEEIEREAIRFAIAHYRKQMSEVARRLKIGRSTLYRKLESLGLDQEDQTSA